MPRPGIRQPVGEDDPVFPVREDRDGHPVDRVEDPGFEDLGRLALGDNLSVIQQEEPVGEPARQV